MKLYNSIPSQFKPPIGSAQLQYVKYFDGELCLWLSEIISTSLDSMMKDSIEVEVHLVTTREKKRDKGEWRREEGERKVDKELEKPSTSRSQEARIDTMLRTMERMMERLLVDGRPPPRETKNKKIGISMLEGLKLPKIGRGVFPIQWLDLHSK